MFLVHFSIETELEWLKEEALCGNYLSRKCSLNDTCTLQHNQFKTPYLWQYKYRGEKSWTNYDKESNVYIEEAFCDPSKTRSGHTDDQQLEVWFLQLPEIHRIHFTNGSNMLYRRLSTKSSVKDKGDEKHGRTLWQWYYEEERNIWKEYNLGVGIILFVYLVSSLKRIVVF